ncbi:Protein of unknown function [Gryllus bimaculatus]|nr:Protein of unknown function [Gryllus bimaculatus]
MYMLLDHAKGVIMRYSSMWQYVDYETFKLEDRIKREAAYRYPEYPDPWKAIKESRIRNEIGISRALYRIELKWKLDEQERLGH